MNIDKSINGEITETSDNGDIKKTGLYNNLNPYSKVEWELSIKPNTTEEIEYTYSVYVRSR